MITSKLILGSILLVALFFIVLSAGLYRYPDKRFGYITDDKGKVKKKLLMYVIIAFITGITLLIFAYYQ